MYIDIFFKHICVAYRLSVNHSAKRVFYAYLTIKSIDYDGNDEHTLFEGGLSSIGAIAADATSR